MHRPIIIANWKVNPATSVEAVLLAQKIERGLIGIKKIEVVVAPSYPFLIPAAQVLKKAELGAQNVFWEDGGPYTGEVSPEMLKSSGVSYVIIGHSERKIYLGETDEMINKKLNAVLGAGLMPVLCVGEKERNGDGIPAVVGEQLKKALGGVGKNLIKKLIVAYEPVWAVSTTAGAKADTPDDAFRALVFIRKILAGLYGRNAAEDVKIIYGGSVSSANIAGFLKEGKMEGSLVGGASLDAQEFIKIVKVASCC